MVIEVTFDTTDVYISTTVSPVYVNVSFEAPSGGGGAVWGDITGTLSDQTDLQTALDAKVPYTGATTNVNLGEYEIKAGQLTLDTSPTGTAAVGTTRWNDTIGSSETTLKGGNVILKNGVDLVARVVNKVSPNTTLTKAAYQAVRVSGAQGQRLAVALAQANNDANSADTIGLVIETIATNQEGFIMTVGQLENINTTGSLQSETWADGDVLYLSGTTAGALTNIKPSAPIHIVVIGYVEYAHANNGKIYVKVMNGWELDELHNVSITSVANNEALIYESATALWKNKSIATALGYTPANAATTLTINGVTFDLSTSRTWSVGSVTGSGASGQVAYWTGTSAQAGSNNLTWDSSTNRLGIGITTPAVNLDILSTGTVSAKIKTSTNTGVAYYLVANDVNSLFEFGMWGSTRTGYGVISSNTGYIYGGVDLNITSETNIRFGVGIAIPDRMRIFGSTGNVGINTGSTDGGQRLQVQGTTLLNGNVTFSSSTGMTWDATNSRLGIGLNSPTADLQIQKSVGSGGAVFAQIKNTNSAGEAAFSILNDLYYAGFEIFGSAFPTVGLRNQALFATQNGVTYLGFATLGNAPIGFRTNTSTGTTNERLTIFGNGNVSINNSTTDSGERLQVTGTMKVTGASSFGGNMALTLNQNNLTSLRITNTNSGASANSEIVLVSNGGVAAFAKNSSGRSSGIFGASDTYFYNDTAGDILFYNGVTTGNIKFATGGSSTAYMTIKSNGRINMSSLPTSPTGLSSGDLWNNLGMINIV